MGEITRIILSRYSDHLDLLHWEANETLADIDSTGLFKLCECMRMVNKVMLAYLDGVGQLECIHTMMDVLLSILQYSSPITFEKVNWV